MIGSLLILGVTLSLDNFRTAVVLGGIRRSDLLTGVALVIMAILVEQGLLN